MFLTHWFNKSSRPTSVPTPRSAPTPSFRPNLESLSDRVVPSSSPFLFDSNSPFSTPWSFGNSSSLISSSSVATQFLVLSRSAAYAGADASVTVVALDANGELVRNYTGTVTLTSSDPNATLPANYTFTSSDNGRHTFTVKLSTTGTDTVTATDTTTSTITGSTKITVNAAPVTTHLFIQTERDVYTGAVTRVVVAALDASNRIVPTYTGTVALTSSVAGDTLPANYTFTSSDKGVHVFTMTPSTTGSDTITATDTTTGTIVGTTTVSVTDAPVATHLAVITRRGATVGSPVQVYVVALDSNNNIARTYAGTVTLTSTDSAAVLPASYTFTAADRGVKALSVTLNTSGSQTITATDTATSTILGSTTVTARSATDLTGVGFGGVFGGFRRSRRG